MTAEMTTSAKRPATTKVRALLSASMTTAACRAMRVVRPTRAVGNPLGPPGVDAAQAELVLGAQHGHAVAGHHLVVPTGALGHFAAVPGHDGHRGQVAEVPAEGRHAPPPTRSRPPGPPRTAPRPARCRARCGPGRPPRTTGRPGWPRPARCPAPTPAPGPGPPRGWPAGSRCGRRDESRGCGGRSRARGSPSPRRRPRPGRAPMPASNRASPMYALRRRCGTPQSSSRRANRLSAESSTTRTGVPLRWSCSTMRSPTPWSPHTIT